jgi:small subunit ribosomal protein S8
MLTDPIGDLLTRIRNALLVRKRYVVVPYSHLHKEILRVMKEEGFIVDFSVLQEGVKKFLHITLKYDEYGEPVIGRIERVSKPGRRVYSGYRSLPRVHRGIGIYILSTSQGIMSDHVARKRKIGGEILCKVW